MDGLMLVLLGAASAALFAGIGSALGCSIAGQAGSGIVTENPDRFIGAMVLQVLPGTQGIYGFVALFMTLNRFGSGDVSVATGLAVLFACLPVAFAGMISAVYQGKVCAAGCSLVAKRPDRLASAMIFAVVVEFYAVLGLLATIFLLQTIPTA